MSTLFDIFQALAPVYGPSAQESQVADTIEAFAGPYADEITRDRMGNLTVRKRGTGPRVAFCAHMDSIGLMVTFIDEHGFLWFSQIGGLTPARILGTLVTFANGTQGIVELRGKVKLADMTLSDLYIDIGAADEAAARALVSIGDVAVFTQPILRLANNRIAAPYIDDRIACAVLLKAMEELPATDNNLYFIFTTQEELGLRGAKTAAYQIQPEFGFSVDVCSVGDTPDCHPKMAVKLGGGAGVKLKDNSVICDPRIVAWLEKTAEAEGIPVQREILITGGTDAAALQTSRNGAMVGGISIPTRYCHNPHAVADLSDAESCVRLVRAACGISL